MSPVVPHPTKGNLVLDSKKATCPLVNYLLHALPLKYHLKVTDAEGAATSLELENHSKLESASAIVITMVKSFGSEKISTLLPKDGALSGAVISFLTPAVLHPTPAAVPALISTVSATLTSHGSLFLVPGTPLPTLADIAAYLCLLADGAATTAALAAEPFSTWFNMVQSHVRSVVVARPGSEWTPKYVEVGEKSLAFFPANFALGSPAPAAAASAGGGGATADSGPSASASASAKPAAAAAAAPVTVTAPAPVAPAPAAGGGGLSEEEKAAARAKREAAKAEKAAKAPPPAPAAADAEGGGEDDEKAEVSVGVLDIRVGKILKAWEHPEADKLFCEEIDLGEKEGPRQIASGLRAFYKKEDLEGKLVIVLANLKKRALVGFNSHGMVMCASNADHTEVQLVLAPEGSVVGERVLCPGHDRAPEPDSKIAKKKLFEKVAPNLVTDDDGVATFKGEAKFTTSKGVCRAERGMKGGHVA